MGIRDDRRWHAVCAQDVLVELRSAADLGLRREEAAARLLAEGRNVISQSRGQPWWIRLLLQLHAPLVYILLVAAAVTAFLGEYTDSLVIAAVLAINALIGFVQESKAARAIDALSRALRIEATVRRDGVRLRIDAAELVKGDIVLLEPGDRVPADVRLLDHAGAVRDLHADESPLTGESAPVAKRQGALAAELTLADRANMVYAGTLITRGIGEGIVVATADRTQVGQINSLIASADNLATPLTRKLEELCNRLLWIILVVAALAFAAGILRGNEPADMFKAAVAIAVGAIPEGLPAAVTVMLAVGVSRMARRQAIIRKLPAVEALGSTTVICSDKTGTLTRNQMTVQAAWVPDGIEYAIAGGGYDPHGSIQIDDEAVVSVDEHRSLVRAMVCGASCNDAQVYRGEQADEWKIRGDPTEAALQVAFLKLQTLDGAPTLWPRLDVIAFESDRQYMATLHLSPAAPAQPPVVYVKGSVERVLQMCDSSMSRSGGTVPLDGDAVSAAAAALARRGLRVLAMACRSAPSGTKRLTEELAEHHLTFLGLQGMLDPPRDEARVAVAACQRAGIRVKMITGDHAITAATIAGMIGIEGASASGVVTGAQMAQMSDEELPGVAARTAVFARMTPEQKLRLVRALQQGEGGSVNIVAMTGDGVNDAPALRQADIGIAMGIGGTEVAKDAADIVLADDHFATIKAAVEEGRSVYANLTKFIVWTLPTNGECLVIIAAIAMGWPLPILPVQALYINMVTAVLLGIPLIFEDREPGIMLVPPRDPAAPLLTMLLLIRTCLVSVVLCIGAMVVFEWELQRGMSHAAGRTAAVSAIVAGEVFYLFSSRALHRAAWRVSLWSNPWLWGGIGAMIAVQAAFAQLPVMNRLFHSAPLDAGAWLRVICAGAAVFVAVEIEKFIRRLARHER